MTDNLSQDQLDKELEELYKQQQKLHEKQMNLIQRNSGYCEKRIYLNDSRCKEVNFEPPVDEVSEMDKYFVKKLDEIYKKYDSLSYHNIWIRPEEARFMFSLPSEYSTYIKFISENCKQKLWLPFLKGLACKFDVDLEFKCYDGEIYDIEYEHWFHIKPYNQPNVDKRIDDLENFLSICKETSTKINQLYKKQLEECKKALSEVLAIPKKEVDEE